VVATHVAVVAPEMTDAEMGSLKDQGIVGVRLNLMRTDRTALSRAGAERFLARVKALDWTAQQVEYGSLLRLLARWLPDPADLERALWRNPARLFGFAESR
jgi:predicted TIM-barrel fold metal-dependent hydrolase